MERLRCIRRENLRIFAVGPMSIVLKNVRTLSCWSILARIGKAMPKINSCSVCMEFVFRQKKNWKRIWKRWKKQKNEIIKSWEKKWACLWYRNMRRVCRSSCLTVWFCEMCWNSSGMKNMPKKTINLLKRRSSCHVSCGKLLGTGITIKTICTRQWLMIVNLRSSRWTARVLCWSITMIYIRIKICRFVWEN